MNSDKHTCVCSLCGQGFTRNSSAKRHNVNLHSGQAIIVKPYDYIIGRLKGEFSPGDSSLYRRDPKNRTKSLVGYGHYHANNNLPSEIHADVWGYQSSPAEQQQQPAGPANRPLYHQLGTPISQPNMESFYRSNMDLERKSKLKELQTLLYRNYDPPIAAKILAQVTYLLDEANDEPYLDSVLMFQRTRAGTA